MTWFTLLTAVLSLLRGLLRMASDRKAITATERAKLADQLLAEAENVDQAFKARLAQRVLDARGVSDDSPDRFRRD